MAQLHVGHAWTLTFEGEAYDSLARCLNQLSGYTVEIGYLDQENQAQLGDFELQDCGGRALIVWPLHEVDDAMVRAGDAVIIPLEALESIHVY